MAASQTTHAQPSASGPSVPGALNDIRGLLADVGSIVANVEALYYDFHEHPELSHHEVRTAGIVAEHLRRCGFQVLTGIGGHGVAGILRNGDGPVVAMRGDMDALPVEEKTGLSYASVARGIDPHGSDVPVMHACGHDVHTACLVGAAELLAKNRDAWSGTLVVIAQPAEETVSGARSMLRDGLYERTAMPDVIVGQHVAPARAGMLIHRAGALMAGAMNVRVEIAGVGGHGSQPQLTVDPIVIASSAVVRLQTIVSRELGPYIPAVVTVGAFHAGTRGNIIPDSAKLELSVRTFDAKTADRVLAAIERIVKAECMAGRSPRDPSVEVLESVPTLINNGDAVARVRAIQEPLLGDVFTAPFAVTGSEDVGIFAEREDGPPIPLVFWLLGGVGDERWNRFDGPWIERMQAGPGNHSPLFYPDPQPTLRRGVEAMVSAALAYLCEDKAAAKRADA